MAQELAVAKNPPTDDDVEYYKVTVKSPFPCSRVMFIPGHVYRVTPAIFNSNIEGLGAFADQCADVEKELKRT